MLLQSSHSAAERGLDAYFTPPEATYSLLAIEKIPKVVWEPACGNGAISKILRLKGHDVFSSDIADYNCGYAKIDYFKAAKFAKCEAIVTNPPYNLAEEFIKKALIEVPYSAWLLRTNFLESTSRLPFFRTTPPTRIWISSRRLPMMHRQGYEGPKAPSNTCFAWFIWDASAPKKTFLHWFDWKHYTPKELNSSQLDSL